MAEEFVRRDYFDQVIQRMSDEDRRVHKRLESVEDGIRKQESITLAMERIRITLDNLINQLETQNQRLRKLEEVPIETNKKVRDALINTITGGLIGAVVTKLLTIL